MLKAIARAAPYLEAYDIETARGKLDHVGVTGDNKVRGEMKKVLDIARNSGSGAFDEKTLFNGEDAIVSLWPLIGRL